MPVAGWGFSNRDHKCGLNHRDRLAEWHRVTLSPSDLVRSQSRCSMFIHHPAQTEDQPRFPVEAALFGDACLDRSARVEITGARLEFRALPQKGYIGNRETPRYSLDAPVAYRRPARLDRLWNRALFAPWSLLHPNDPSLVIATRHAPLWHRPHATLHLRITSGWGLAVLQAHRSLRDIRSTCGIFWIRSGRSPRAELHYSSQLSSELIAILR